MPRLAIKRHVSGQGVVAILNPVDAIRTADPQVRILIYGRLMVVQGNQRGFYDFRAPCV
jgi:hypothetical protein